MLAARMGDLHVCPLVTGVVPHVGGPIAMGHPLVLTGGIPQARVGDICVCVGPPDVIVKGSMGVFVGGPPAARMGDLTAHGGTIVVGHPLVMIGDLGGGGGGGGGGGMVTPRMGVEGKLADMAASAKVMIAASLEGVPFAEQCLKGL